MAKRKASDTRSSKSPVSATGSSNESNTLVNSLKSSSRATVSGPSLKVATAKAMANDTLALKAAATAELAAAFPYNVAKAAEFDPQQSKAPPAGQTQSPSFHGALASTLTEGAASAKLGDGAQALATNPNNGPLDRVRVDST